MIGFLRFLGLINTAVWLGAAVFMLLGVESAAASAQMQELIGQNNFPYFSLAIAQVIQKRFLYVCLVCGSIAIGHMAAEWLYLGKYASGLWVGILGALLVMSAVQGGIVQPSLRRSHSLEFKPRAAAEERQLAAKSARVWRGVSRGINSVMVLGLIVYLWRVGNPQDPMRFVTARQFRS